MASVDSIMYQLIDQINKNPQWRPIYDAMVMLARNQDQVRDRTGGELDNTSINTAKIADNSNNITLNAANIAQNTAVIAENTAAIEDIESRISTLSHRNRLLEQLIYELMERHDSGT